MTVKEKLRERLEKVPDGQLGWLENLMEVALPQSFRAFRTIRVTPAREGPM